jgi:hypothetical protein
MAGALINLLPKTAYDFSGIGTGSVPITAIAGPVDVLQYVDAAVIIRVHSISIAPTNSITFGIVDDGFVPGSDLPYLSSFFIVGYSLVSSTGAPALVSVFGPANGQYMTLGLAAQRPAGGALSATVSIDVLLRSSDETTLDGG